MKKILLMVSLVLIISGQILAQTPRFAKYQINETGFFAYFPQDPGKFDVTVSQDSLHIYQGETEIQACKYGLILVVLEDKFATASNEELLSLLESYMDFLKTSFEISNAAGYGKGHTIDSNPQAQGIIDYWENSAGLQYVVNGWIDKNALCFLYISGKEQPNYNYQSLFLNGFRFKN